MRSKEDAHDYRYFPDPDLKPLIIADEELERISADLNESYEEKVSSYISLGLNNDDVEILLSESVLSNFFDKSLELLNEPKLISNWIITELIKYKNDVKLDPNNFVELLKMVKVGSINNNSAKEVLSKIVKTNESPEKFVKDMGLTQESSEDYLISIIDEVIQANPSEYQRIKDGEEKLLAFFVGQTMKLTKGKGNPQIINKILKEKI